MRFFIICICVLSLSFISCGGDNKGSDDSGGASSSGTGTGTGTGTGSGTGSGTGTGTGTGGTTLGKACGARLGNTCAKSQYCENGPHCSAADKPGTCQIRPQACNRMSDPVCGCNGKDYSNPCSANSAGVSVKSKGKCKTSGGVGCIYNGVNYKPGESFKSIDGCNSCSCSATSMIVCTKKACIKTCNYNGKTYKSGTSFKSTDGCNNCNCLNGLVACTKKLCPTKSCGGIAGKKCLNKNDFCDTATHCGVSDQMGVCRTKPQVCTMQISYVCGCNGITYSNGCAANALGISIKQKGKCLGTGTSGMGKCKQDSDCKVFSDYCNGCACRGLKKGDVWPACQGTKVSCLKDPCQNKKPYCNKANNKCAVK